MLRIKIFLLIILCSFSNSIFAAILYGINVENSDTLAEITLNFKGKPTYFFFLRDHPYCLVLDMRQNGMITGLPYHFKGKNIIQRIRNSRLKSKQKIRLIFELTHKAKTYVKIIHKNHAYRMTFKIHAIERIRPNRKLQKISSNIEHFKYRKIFYNKLISTRFIDNTLYNFKKKVRRHRNLVIVAIDAGHGGQDPGASSQKGLHEKNITIVIARKLKALMDRDNIFKGILTRNGDYFISVKGRSEIARKSHANFLISIHVDSAHNHSVTGASVWVLSNRRAKIEMAHLLAKKEKQLKLLGGLGALLINRQIDQYLSQTILDLQFDYSKRVGYEVALKVLQQLNYVTSLHKRLPQHASLGILRSPDIPSLLVEIGFISNSREARLINTKIYQKKIAQSIYKGLRNYFLVHSIQSMIDNPYSSLNSV
ncbi:N-acetylmuramoyl-L-alanine amidase [Candidatus Pantoea carbekii]|uniref:N-acetylmuramoyl-L-alanine amidase n=1 Tax=Candidatus Pantoea carbekii TaxID=1235990 RepID=U3U5V3_9GAMM|nr:N-acetylmuramoyl-L-alanine amidase [Candidatus Pantoea carbekii]AKC32518.1 N-acetylmuramoyl-L-alanine amidase AmiB [Candidatus Pantoea carbekii]BAO00245.1 hypothetical protein HHS_02750 [Candidatus Pantoea carbekii]